MTAINEENLVGRPLKFKSVQDLEEQIESYFESCYEDVIVRDNKGGAIVIGGEIVKEKVQTRPYTITGLALHLDTSRQTLLNYQEKEEYFDTITRAKLRIENYGEESLWKPKITAGVVFNLSNNFNWKNKQEIDHTTKNQPIKQINYIVPNGESTNQPTPDA